VFHVHIGNGIGDREYTVTSVGELDRSYELGIGTLRLDLSQLSLPANETRTVKVRVDIGDTEIIVPAGVSLHAKARARAGDIRVLGDDSNGWEVEREASSAGSQGTLIVDAEVGAGSIRIDRAVP
jgi:predicted membrane protein